MLHILAMAWWILYETIFNTLVRVFSVYSITLIILALLYWSGHIQISQIPNRNEPSDNGTINFSSFFKGLEEAGYDGWVAAEYFATGIYVKE